VGLGLEAARQRISGPVCATRAVLGDAGTRFRETSGAFGGIGLVPTEASGVDQVATKGGKS